MFGKWRNYLANVRICHWFRADQTISTGGLAADLDTYKAPQLHQLLELETALILIFYTQSTPYSCSTETSIQPINSYKPRFRFVITFTSFYCRISFRIAVPKKKSPLRPTKNSFYFFSPRDYRLHHLTDTLLITISFFFL